LNTLNQNKQLQHMKISEKIKELGLMLPPAPAPAGLYKPVLVVDNFLYISGQGCLREDGTLIVGRVGDNLTLEEGKAAARQTALTMLATITTHFGDVDRIKRLVKSLGMVNCTPDFGNHPLVINGYSELMADVFGPENGVGVRSAVGMMLPGGIAVEIEAMFELHK
jgi:enamine deaminase RidA (YjgF/YER057c/UK114 family)